MSRLLAYVNRVQRHLASHVLLYHATFRTVPKSLAQGLHNVHPEELYRQLAWLKRHFDIVDVDSLLANPRVGAFAITFDDAYACVFSEALPVLAELGLCCTVFINGVTLSGKPLWRDKVRYVVNHGLVDAFVDHYEKLYGGSWAGLRQSFYAASKDPRTANSARLDRALDGFFEGRHVRMEHLRYCASASDLLRSPLVRYGNHSYNHYVPSSLSLAEQEAEIGGNDRMLRALGLETSRVFSIPFGGERDFNENTMRVLRQAGYRGFLYSRNRLNVRWPGQTGQFMHPVYHVPYLDRYMVPSTFAGFQKELTRLALTAGRY